MVNYCDVKMIADILEENIRSCERNLNNTMCIYNSDIGAKSSVYWEKNVHNARIKFERAKAIHNTFVTEHMQFFDDAY